MSYGREIKYMRKQFEKARLNMIFAQSHDNTPQEQIKNLVEKIKIHETILDALEIASRVVRCNDCKHGGMFVIEDKVPFFACYKDRPNIKPVKRDWFCANGVRKEDE